MLIYRVEQIFLIHKETGLVLQHVAADLVDVKDADMVSAMITAIQDFVRDSFSGTGGDLLDTLNFGESTIWIEQGPRAVLAAAIRGNPPLELRTTLEKTLENVEFEYGPALDNFKGDAAPFEACKPDLIYCLSQAQQMDTRTNKMPIKSSIKGIKQNKGKKENLILYIYIAAALCIAILIVGFILSIL